VFLERIAQLVLQGAARPPEIKLYPLSQAAEAHELQRIIGEPNSPAREPGRFC
jgi:hypothetical protein